MESVRYTIVADSTSLRWQYYHRDLLRFWSERGLSPTIYLIEWREAIARRGRLDTLLSTDQTSIFRLESPARDTLLAIALAQLGNSVMAGNDHDCWGQPSDTAGWIVSPLRVYRGLCRVLQGISQSAGRLPGVEPSRFEDVATLFDKNATSRKLVQANLAVPDSFEPVSVAHLIDALQGAGWNAAFVKLAYGSCASGIARIELGDDPSAITTVHCSDGRFFNTRRLKQVRGEELEEILAFLISERAIAQRAVALPRLGSQNFDVRVVVVHGEIAATVFRASPHPMTNLHLGGRRADGAECRRIIPQRQWLDGLDLCLEAASLFDLVSLGVDLAFDRTTFQPCILEMNAFGDFFPDWTDNEGRSIHAQEIAATAAAHGFP